MKYFSTKVINSKVLLQNFEKLKACSNKKICAVVKANAYGHGVKQICGVLKDYCDFFAVQNICEAMEVKLVAKSSKVLVLGKCANYKSAISKDISITIDNLQELYDLINLDLFVKIHLKIDTGMNRFGIKSLSEFKKFLIILKQNPKVYFEGIYTHCFDSINAKTTMKQIFRFEKFVKLAHDFGYNPIVHIGGSGLVEYGIDFVDYIRCGLALYGYGNCFVKPIMKIESKIVKLVDVVAGDNVGYDNYFVAQSNMKIAVIPLGYADGLKRGLQNKLFVNYQNTKLFAVGKFCMDCIFVDVTNINLKVFDKVTVFCDAQDWARQLNQTPYEILTALNNMRCEIKIV